MMVLGELAEERAEQRVGEQRRCSGCPWSSGEGARVAASRELKKRRGRAAKVRVEVLLELRVERRMALGEEVDEATRSSSGGARRGAS